ncbi:hypothetical protein BCL69_100974 [Nitrosomonas communis]|uniref:Uncharacterized protein n=1 Tax=Nitrosomonas communis TaxID=44574 RepID=A0A5D3YDY9_9PROT|nr:hypothetical protein BCL69_100974 [Nitrosomonas communis]
MARSASGKEILDQAKALLINARPIEESKQAQAVVLPLELGLSIEQTTTAIGVSIGWACQFRRRFIRIAAHMTRPSLPMVGDGARIFPVRGSYLSDAFYRKSSGWRCSDCKRNQAGIRCTLKTQDIARSHLLLPTAPSWLAQINP